MPETDSSTEPVELRDYQRECLTAIFERYQKGKLFVLVVVNVRTVGEGGAKDLRFTVNQIRSRGVEFPFQSVFQC